MIQSLALSQVWDALVVRVRTMNTGGPEFGSSELMGILGVGAWQPELGRRQDAWIKLLT